MAFQLIFKLFLILAWPIYSSQFLGLRVKSRFWSSIVGFGAVALDKSFIINYDIIPITFSNANIAKSFIRALNKSAGKMDETKWQRPYFKKKANRTISEEAMDMIMSVNGLGEKKAQVLLTYFGSVKKAINASRSELEKILGKKKADHFIEVINRNIFKECLNSYIKGEKSNDK